MATGAGGDGSDGDSTLPRPIRRDPPVPTPLDAEKTLTRPASGAPVTPRRRDTPGTPTNPDPRKAPARPASPDTQAMPGPPAIPDPRQAKARSASLDTQAAPGPPATPRPRIAAPEAKPAAPQRAAKAKPAAPQGPPQTRAATPENPSHSVPGTPPAPETQVVRQAPTAESQRSMQQERLPAQQQQQAYPQNYGGPQRSVMPPQGHAHFDQPGRRERRDLSSRDRVRAREARWQNNRLAVPYPTDGPKISLGIVWFSLLIGGVLLGSYFDQGEIAAVAIAGVAAPIAGLAGLQTGNAWFPTLSATRGWTAVAAYLAGIAGFYGPWGVIAGIGIGVVTLMFYVTLYRGHARTTLQLFDVLLRSAIPVGIAVASLAALGVVGIGVQLSLILLVSAYEAGDFVVGSGSSNAVEGPMAGLVSLGAVTFLLFLVLPAPFDASTILLFGALAAICCPLGQILASALLPRGNAWAPGLRRLDSYLLAAPLWLILAVQLPSLN